jgi:hypothetical protein
VNLPARFPAPPGVQLAEELAAVVGAEAAHRLFDAFGGRSIYVPARPGPNHPITVAIGAERAALLAEYYHQVRLDFPLSASKRRRAIELSRTGVPVGEIARQLWLTDRHVRRILAEARRAPPGQPGLFG